MSNREDSKLDNEVLSSHMAERVRTHDICYSLVKRDAILFIDDFEMASDDIVEKVSQMCKLLTQSYVSDNARILIVGTDDIFRRLVEGSKYGERLDYRLEEISIGTFPNKSDSWKFLSMGFDKLGLYHPVQQYADKYIKYNTLTECVDAVYEAADGLPKSLNALGKNICLGTTPVRMRINPPEIIEAAKKMPERNLKLYRSEYPKVIRIIERNTVASAILQHLYTRKGIGQIHTWDDIDLSLQREYSVEQIENALCELVEVGFLTQTGFSNDVLFVSNPALAHTLGVILSKPEKYNIPRSFFNKSGQLVLPLLRRDPKN